MAKVPINPVERNAPGAETAPVAPLDVTGTRTMLVGTAIWLVALLVLLPFYGRLHDRGDAWWLWTTLAGVGLGLFGVAYCRRRERHLDSASRSSDH